MVVKLALSLREEHRLRVFENKVLRKVFGAKKDEITREWRKLHALYSSTNIIRSLKSRRGGLVAQAVRRSPATAGVSSSRLGHSMWVSWWTKRDLGRFFMGFLPFSPTTNFIPPFLHTHLIHFRFISSALVMVRQAWLAGTLATHGPII